MSKKLGTYNKNDIKIFRELSIEEYGIYKTNIKKIIEFSHKQQLFIIVDNNFQDINNILATYLANYKSNYGMGWLRMEMMFININRLLLNFLSSFRTLLDHLEYRLSNKYGKESAIFKEFKNVCSDQFDKYFSYRFLYKLRNYAQHCGMPIGSLKISAKIDNPSLKTIKEYLAISFNRDDLLNTYDSWGNIKDEIARLPEQFEVNNLLNELMECISRINSKIISKDLNELIPIVDTIRNMILPLQNMTGTPVIFDIDTTNFKNNPNFTIEWLPLHIIDIFTKIMETKNVV